MNFSLTYTDSCEPFFTPQNAFEDGAFTAMQITKRALQRNAKTADSFGYVYVIHNSGRYKIGMTTNIKKRLPSIDSGAPEKSRLIALLRTPRYEGVEAHLHSLLKPKRHHGEWFNLEPKDVDGVFNYLNRLGTGRHGRRKPRNRKAWRSNKMEARTVGKPEGQTKRKDSINYLAGIA